MTRACRRIPAMITRRRTRRLVLDVTVEEGPQFRLGELTLTGMGDQDAEALRRKWTLKAGDIYDDSYIQRVGRGGAAARRSCTTSLPN